MSLQAVATITRREVRETLTDWRILVPITLLTLILPQLLVVASRLVIDFVEDAALTGRLVPFAALLVGFVPSSFSLITALESFVGERERNTLESLLSMPVSDRELYLGKLFSALFTPLLASYMAMTVFTLLLYAVDQRLYFDSMTPGRLFLLFLMVGLLALVMVAGAVVISSQTTSLRAANLMSSMVLLPASLIVQGEAFLVINERWDIMWLIVGVLATLGLLLVRVGLRSFSRESILSREHRTVDTRLVAGSVRLVGHDVQTGDRSETSARSRSIVPTIALREIRETVTDWRVLLPVFILSVLVPLGLVAATPFAITFVGDAKLLGRLVPFALLLVGFIPSSFSLITALESFVGERERNTLESLLAMPVGDGQLYLSKLLSSLFAPLLTSYGGMLVFASAFGIAFPDLFASTMTFGRLIQLMLMIGAMTVVMVSGAVVISSHTSSIRAATLLASFVLIPMSVVLMTESILIIASRWDVMWVIISALVVIAVALARTGLAAFNREEILSREHEQLNLQRIRATFTTFFSEYQPAGVTPEGYAGLPFSAPRFYQTELWALLRANRAPIVLALLAALGGLLAGRYIGTTYRVRAFDMFLNNLGSSPEGGPLLAIIIFANNLRVSILAPLASTFSFGLFAFLVPAVAFAQIGFVSSVLTDRGGSWLALGDQSPLQFVLAYVIPHGIIELPTFILCAAMGIRLGASLLAPPKGFTVGQHLLWSLANYAKLWLLVIAPMALFGALIEGFISPMVIRTLYGA